MLLWFIAWRLIRWVLPNAMQWWAAWSDTQRPAWVYWGSNKYWGYNTGVSEVESAWTDYKGVPSTSALPLVCICFGIRSLLYGCSVNTFFVQPPPPLPSPLPSARWVTDGRCCETLWIALDAFSLIHCRRLSSSPRGIFCVAVLLLAVIVHNSMPWLRARSTASRDVEETTFRCWLASFPCVCST